MLFARINRSSPEKIFLVVYNSHATNAMTNGQAVVWDYQTDKNGSSVTFPTARATHSGAAFAGVAVETIAKTAYGLIQVYGYHSAVRTRALTGSVKDIALGTPLAVNVAGSVNCMESYLTSTDTLRVVNGGFALAALAVATTAAIAVFIKSL